MLFYTIRPLWPFCFQVFVRVVTRHKMIRHWKKIIKIEKIVFVCRFFPSFLVNTRFIYVGTKYNFFVLFLWLFFRILSGFCTSILERKKTTKSNVERSRRFFQFRYPLKCDLGLGWWYDRLAFANRWQIFVSVT